MPLRHSWIAFASLLPPVLKQIVFMMQVNMLYHRGFIHNGCKTSLVLVHHKDELHHGSLSLLARKQICFLMHAYGVVMTTELEHGINLKLL